MGIALNSRHDRSEPVDVCIGARIRMRRRALGLSQTQLAAALGVSFQQVQKYESGVNRIAASTLVRTAAALEMTVATLVGEGDADPLDACTYVNLATPGAQELLASFVLISDQVARDLLLDVIQRLADAKRVPVRAVAAP
jgi:transcriptional regulator with XRE-family HTH domain